MWAGHLFNSCTSFLPRTMTHKGLKTKSDREHQKTLAIVIISTKTATAVSSESKLLSEPLSRALDAQDLPCWPSSLDLTVTTREAVPTTIVLIRKPKIRRTQGLSLSPMLTKWLYYTLLLPKILHPKTPLHRRGRPKEHRKPYPLTSPEPSGARSKTQTSKGRNSPALPRRLGHKWALL